jgi:hypothetical protein
MNVCDCTYNGWVRYGRHLYGFCFKLRVYFVKNSLFSRRDNKRQHAV